MTSTTEKSEYATQHLKDIKLAIEFKHLAKHAPGGVYLMPELHDIRKLHGVIFVRRGLYRDGVFRFVMTLPPEYNDINTHPSIFFTPPIYHPLIDPISGELKLRVEESIREWIPGRHFCLTALVFLKKIFYLKSYDHFETLVVANESARHHFNNEQSIFLSNVQESVQDSLQRIYTEPEPTCMLRFSAPIPAHDVIKDNILAGSNNVAVSEEKERRNSDSNNNHSNIMENNDNVASITKKLEFCYDATNEAEDADDRDAKQSIL